MNAQIVLRIEATSAADLIHLPMSCGHALDARSDRAAVGLCSDQLQGYPVITGLRVAMEELWHRVDGIDEYVDTTVVVEITECAAAAAGDAGYARAGERRGIAEGSVTKIFIKDLGLLVVRVA